MGIRLVKRVHSADWAHLPPIAKNVLTCMAITALDPKDDDQETEGRRQPRHYYAGHEHIGKSEYGVTKDHPDWAKTEQKITRAIAVLKKHGALRVVRPAVHGRVAIYELLPGRPTYAPPSNTTPAPAGKPKTLRELRATHPGASTAELMQLAAVRGGQG